MNELNNKSAIITGASRGIGAAIAKEFARNGISVILAARSAEELENVEAEIREMGGKVEKIICDVSRFDDVSAAVELCQSVYGKVNILVNNAGVIDPIARITDSDPKLWGQVVDINYKGVYYGLRAAIPAMLKSGGGTIINISSGAATSALEGWSHYCSTKAAVLSLTMCADKEYGDEGINAIGLSPGTVATDMQVSIKKSGINPVSQLDPNIHISPDIVARAATWLCTTAAKSFSGTDFSLKNEDHRKLIEY